MTNIYDYQVLPQDLDSKRHFRLVALEKALLNTAGRAADDRDFGAFKLMDGEGISWVLLKFACEMEVLPTDSDTIHIETWVASANRLLTTRNYIVRDDAGRVMGYASSEWTMLNLKTRRPVNLTADTSILSYVTGQTVPVELPSKLPTVDAPAARTHRVAYSDIDYNGHTNSMQYLQWMLDSYPVEAIYDRKVARLEIMYIKEVLHGQTVTVHWQDAEDGSLTRFTVRTDEGTDCARATIFWGAEASQAKI